MPAKASKVAMEPAAAAGAPETKRRKKSKTRVRGFEWVGVSAPGKTEGRRNYSAILIGGHEFHAGDYVLVAGHEPNKHWVAKLEELWDDTYGDMWGRMRWMYTPEDTAPGRQRSQHERELLSSNHIDDNMLDTITGRAVMLSQEEWEAREATRPRFWTAAGEREERLDADDEDEATLRRETYLLRSHYDTVTRQVRHLKHQGGAAAGAAASSSAAGARAADGDSDDDGAARPSKAAARRAAAAGAADRTTAAVAVAAAAGDGDDEEDAPWALPAGRAGKGAAAAAAVAPRAPPATAAEFAALCRSAQDKLALAALPASLPCRDKERAAVRAFLEDAVAKGGLGAALFVAGMPGTGKTATVFEVVRDLKAAHRRGDLPAFRCHVINAMNLASPYMAYSVLYKKIFGGEATPKRAAELLDAHFNQPSSDKKAHVVILDELDHLVTRKQSVLYNFFDWPSRRHARLIVIGIANTMDLPDRLLPKVSSRLGMGRIAFPAYNKEQIATIVGARLEGLPAFEKDAIKMAAAKAAQVSGDVRKALQLCRHAAEIAATAAVRAEAACTAAAAASAAGGGAAAAAAPPMRPLAVRIDDVNAAAKALSASLHAQALCATGPWERQLLVALAAHLRHAGSDDAPALPVFERAVAYSQLMKTVAAGGDGAASAAAAGGAGAVDVAAAELLAGYACAPTLLELEGIATLLHGARLLVIDNVSGSRYPRLRLNVQASDIAVALRDDPLVQRVLAD